MKKRFLTFAVAMTVAGSLSGCYVEDDTPDGGGGGTTVIERDRTIERDTQPDVNINNPPAPAPDVNIHNQPPADTKTETKTETETRTEP